MWEQTALVVEIVGLVRQVLAADWEGSVRVKVLGRVILAVEWSKPNEIKGFDPPPSVI